MLLKTKQVMKRVAYGAFLILITVLLEIEYPSSLVFSPLLKPSYGGFAALFLYTINLKIVESPPIQLISYEELGSCVFCSIMVFIATVYFSGVALGFEHTIENIPPIFLGGLVLFSIMWLLSSLAPRSLYRLGFLEIE
jgi:hypothetical protein